MALAGTGAVVGEAGPADAVAGVAPACVAYPGTVEQAAGVMTRRRLPRHDRRAARQRADDLVGTAPGPLRCGRGHDPDGPHPRARGR